ncbi:hypothetical protein ACKKBF_B38535 [Auxenochlorella protothecoides x Auxenochlorella symbiontica]
MAPPVPLGTRSKRRKVDDGTGPRSLLGKKTGRGLYHCDYCHKDLSNALHIRCAVCPDFDLCLDCFSVGAAITPHSSAHAYKVVGNLSFPIYHPEWGADEEILLVEGVELYGLGNWEAVGEHVGRDPGEARAHYMSVYVETACFPDPQPSPAMAGVDIQALIDAHRSTTLNKMASARIALASPAATPRVKSESTPGAAAWDAANGGAMGPGHSVAPENLAAALLAANPEPRHAPGDGAAGATASGRPSPGSTLSTAAGHALAGRSPHAPAPHDLAQPQRAADSRAPSSAERAPLESVRKLEPEANILQDPLGAGVAGTPAAASPAEIGAKVALAEAQQTGYNLKRNEFEQEYDHEAECIISEMEFREEDSEEVVAQKLELIAIYNRRLDERDQRRAFILDRGLLNVKRQAAVDRRRSAAERAMAGQLRAFARYLPQAQYEALADGMLAEARLCARIAELQEYRALGLRTFEEVDELEASGDRPRRKENAPPSQAARMRLNRVPIDEARLQEHLLSGLGFAHAAMSLHQKRTTVEEGRGTSGLAAWRGKRGTLLDITALPDAEVLLQQERHLCASERYLPAQYLAIKASVLEVQERRGVVTPGDVTALPFKVDVQRMLRLYDFFSGQGWI